MSKDVKAVPTRLSLVPSVEPDNRAPVGLRVKGRYHVVSELGTGVYGTVCLAVDETDGREIAIRFLPRELVDLSQPKPARRRLDQSPADQTIIEASIAHSSLVRVLEFGEAETGQAFAAMDLVHGRRLSAILSEGPLEAQTALRIAIDLGGAVETLHNMGLVHGALRPSNVMIAGDGHATLMDVEVIGARAAQAVHGILIDEPPRNTSPRADPSGPGDRHDGHLCLRRDPLRDALRRAAIPGGDSRGRAGQASEGDTRPDAAATPYRSRFSRGYRRARALQVPEPRPPIQTILNSLWRRRIVRRRARSECT